VFILKIFSAYGITEITFPLGDDEDLKVNHGWRYIFYGILGLL
jgi:hypothetical protein